MKSTDQVVKEYGYARLIRSIVRAVGKHHFRDIYNHGADAGYPGITYTSDCISLAWRNKREIRSMLEQYSEDLGEDIGEMLQTWRCIGKDYSKTELVRSLYKDRTPDWDNDTDRTLWNGLAWFAAEEVSRWFCE